MSNISYMSNMSDMSYMSNLSNISYLSIMSDMSYMSDLSDLSIICATWVLSYFIRSHYSPLKISAPAKISRVFSTRA